MQKVDPRKKAAEMEKEILNFWQENNIFEKSVEKEAPNGQYVFYDGPPFATGTPHYGHIVASAIKDVVPRYWTMRGYRVERKWGWDCHGLPIENIAEKELGVTQKKEIEKMGVEKFNETCRSRVLAYVDEWKKIIPQLGRWADMENSYRTMDKDFMESVWWVFKRLWEEDLVYEDYRSMHICPRCETTLSQSEVAEGYQDIKDLSVVAKFELEEEPGTYVLAWTTTPWTLLGNVALAVGGEIDYVRVTANVDEKGVLKKVEGASSGKSSRLADNLDRDRFERVIMSKDFYEKLKDEGYYFHEAVSEKEEPKKIKGKDLMGKKYKPLFDFYAKDKNLENRENGWKIYSGEFVNTEEGTGVVHIAPAFGEDDMQLGKKHNLPFVQHVNLDGSFKKETGEFAGMNVKPRDSHQATDVEIIKYLAKNGLLFSKEKYEHSYPHCWRCDTPLLNYATSSWFVAVAKIKEKMLKEAQKISWQPRHIKEGRWGNWLEGARDWSISRQRYWASVIPIWKCSCGEIKVIGNVAELEKKANSGSFHIMRHGEAQSNVERVLSSRMNDGKFLTEKGKKDVAAAAEKLKGSKIDLIISSDIDRTKQTSQILADKLGVKVIYDERLRETDVGDYNGMKIAEVAGFKEKWQEGVNMRFPNGDDWFSIKNRVESFYNQFFNNYRGKQVLVVAHGDILTALEVCLSGEDYLEKIKQAYQESYIQKAEFRELNHRIMDLHKHVVDEVSFPCEQCGGTMRRIPDVLDCWFESGSMPYAQAHYPMENKQKFEEGFPAQFIAEGIDQTRAWFYYLHVLATGVMNSVAFENVVVNGIVLAEDGKKMSKRLQNYPDPVLMMEKYGSDSLRYYLMASPVVMAENLNFSERDLEEVSRGLFRMLWNSYSFFTLYATIDNWKPNWKPKKSKKEFQSENLLDKWILSELQLVVREFNRHMEQYELNKAARLLPGFVDNLSNWYIRRSRRRFWKSEAGDQDKQAAYQTLWSVLTEFSKVIAPFCPFVAEEIYRNLMGLSNSESELQNHSRQDEPIPPTLFQKGEAGKGFQKGEAPESVHLCEFPTVQEELIDEELSEKMSLVRKAIEMGLALRSQEGIKVRQPLAECLVLIAGVLDPEFLELIKDELNVKQVKIAEKEEVGLKWKKESDLRVGLNTKITPELALEGQMRELTRQIQEARKKAGFVVEDRIQLFYSGGEEIFDNFSEEIAGEILADQMTKKNSVGLEKEELDFQADLKIEKKEIRIGLKRS